MQNPANFLKETLSAWQENQTHTVYERLKEAATLHVPDHYPLPTPNALALEGGGPRGRLYISGFEGISELKLTDNIRVMAGTSVGAILQLSAVWDLMRDKLKKFQKISIFPI